jgi:hypothetical protein
VIPTSLTVESLSASHAPMPAEGHEELVSVLTKRKACRGGRRGRKRLRDLSEHAWDGSGHAWMCMIIERREKRMIVVVQ